MTGWTKTFSAMTNMLLLDFRNTNLKTAAVDYILQDVATIATANTLYNKTLYLSGTTFPQPESLSSTNFHKEKSCFYACSSSKFL